MAAGAAGAAAGASATGAGAAGSSPSAAALACRSASLRWRSCAPRCARASALPRRSRWVCQPPDGPRPGSQSALRALSPTHSCPLDTISNPPRSPGATGGERAPARRRAQSPPGTPRAPRLRARPPPPARPPRRARGRAARRQPAAAAAGRGWDHPRQSRRRRSGQSCRSGPRRRAARCEPRAAAAQTLRDRGPSGRPRRRARPAASRRRRAAPPRAGARRDHRPCRRAAAVSIKQATTGGREGAVHAQRGRAGPHHSMGAGRTPSTDGGRRSSSSQLATPCRCTGVTGGAGALQRAVALAQRGVVSTWLSGTEGTGCLA